MYTSTTCSSLSTVDFLCILYYRTFFFLFLFSLRSVHRFKSNYARRLINAVIKNIPLTKEIFKPNEQIINNSIRFDNRRKT
jgi:hypothetical protein